MTSNYGEGQKVRVTLHPKDPHDSKPTQLFNGVLKETDATRPKPHLVLVSNPKGKDYNEWFEDSQVKAIGVRRVWLESRQDFILVDSAASERLVLTADEGLRSRGSRFYRQATEEERKVLKVNSISAWKARFLNVKNSIKDFFR